MGWDSILLTVDHTGADLLRMWAGSNPVSFEPDAWSQLLSLGHANECWSQSLNLLLSFHPTADRIGNGCQSTWSFRHADKYAVVQVKA